MFGLKKGPGTMVFRSTFIRLVLIEPIRQMVHYLDAHGKVALQTKTSFV